jgi:hypothetical protein
MIQNLRQFYQCQHLQKTTSYFTQVQSEMLKVTEDGFYVRGVKVEADEKEASSVYKAFKEFLVYHALTRN